MTDRTAAAGADEGQHRITRTERGRTRIEPDPTAIEEAGP